MLLGQEGVLAEVGWDGCQREKLWRYNQHYFDDLNAEGAQQRSGWHHALLDRWATDIVVGRGTAWEPYPTSLRIVNWIKWSLAGNALPAACLQLLAVQARWISQRMEIHLLGNHLLANAKALVFAGLFFDSPEARSWLDKGLLVLKREVSEQVLADGGQFERSTMYHAIALEDMLDLCNILSSYAGFWESGNGELRKSWRATAQAMAEWLRCMCHPDGEIAFFNDAAFGVAPHPNELEAYARRLGMALPDAPASRLRWLQPSGYVRVQDGPALALLDLAPVGPNYLPGHAHADTLSFELSINRQRVLVNSGTSCYGTGLERHRQRGTAAHNTVVVGGEDSSEVWSGFRVARRARVVKASAVERDGVVMVDATHDGYLRLPHQPLHRRQWEMDAETLAVTDCVSEPRQGAEARFHFHPAVQVLPAAQAAEGLAKLPDGTAFRWKVEVGQAQVQSATWHPRFGSIERNTRLSVNLVNGRSVVRMWWHNE